MQTDAQIPPSASAPVYTGRMHDWSWWLIICLWLVIGIIRIGGWPDLMDNEQELQSSYVMDALQNHNWLCQRDWTGDITSKPPLYTWLAAAAQWPLPRMNRLAMCLPSALATLATALIVLRLGRRHFGPRAGAAAAMIYLLCLPVMKQVGMARMDGLFPFTITLGVLAAWNGLERGRGWIWFWLAAAASTLTKGPFGILVSAAGLISVMFSGGVPTAEEGVRPASGRTWQFWLENIGGLALFLAITGGWLVAACLTMDGAYNKLIRVELFSQSVQTYKGVHPGQLFYVPPLHFLSRFLPWSIFTCAACVRLWRNPATTGAARRFERFVFFWLVGGIVPFCLASHQRADLIFPIYPAAALLAGRELVECLFRLSRSWRVAIPGVLAGGFLGYGVFHYQVDKPREVEITMAVRDMARSIEHDGGAQFPVTYAGAPFALDYYLNTMRAEVTAQRAAGLLAGPDAAYVAVCDRRSVKDLVHGVRLHELYSINLRLPRGAGQSPWIFNLCILANRPLLRTEYAMALGVGALDIHVRGLHVLHASECEFSFAGHGTVSFTNTSEQAVWVKARAGDFAQRRSIPPHDTWRLTIP